MSIGSRLASSPLIDLSGERCAKSVHGLSAMTRRELEIFLETTARASANVVLMRPPRPKPAKLLRWRLR